MHITIESKKIELSPSFQEYVEKQLEGKSLYSVAIEELVEYLSDSESDIFWDCLYELYPGGELLTKINCKTARETFIAKTQENIEAYREDYNIILKIFDDSTGACELLTISGADILLAFLENESSYGEFDAKVSGYVEESFDFFVANSYWHCGYINNDGKVIELISESKYSFNFNNEQAILWFGPAGKQREDIWTIKYGKLLAEEWFEVDQWTLLKYLIDDCDDCFSIWYCAECCRCLPDMEEILKTCPIGFDQNETIETINQKFEEYFKTKFSI